MFFFYFLVPNLSNLIYKNLNILDTSKVKFNIYINHRVVEDISDTHNISTLSYYNISSIANLLLSKAHIG